MNKQLRDGIIIQTIITFILNGVINAVIAYFLNRGNAMEAMTMSQNYSSIFFDILISSPLLGFFNAGLAVVGMKKKKSLALLPSGRGLARLAGFFRRPFIMGLVMGLCLAPVVWALSSGIFWLAGVQHITLWGFTVFKGIYTAILGGFFSVTAVFAALHAPAMHKPDAIPGEPAIQ